MRSKTNRKRGLWISGGFILSVLVLGASFLASDLSVFFSHLNSFSYSVRNHDRDEAVQGLENLKSDYNVFSSRKLQYFADRWLFNKMYRYEAAVSILNENFEKVLNEDLKNRDDDYYVSYMRGIAEFKILRIAFQQAMAKKDKKQMAAIHKLVLERARPHFEKCVKEGPGPAKNFNCSYDYDITSNSSAAMKALMSQEPEPQYILAPPSPADKEKKSPGGKEPDKKGPPQLTPDEKKNAGRGGAKKVG